MGRRRRHRAVSRRALVVTGVAGLAAALALALMQRHDAAAHRVLVATVPVAAGTPLDELTLAEQFREVQLTGDPLIAGLVDASTVDGRRVAAALLPGEPVTEASLGGEASVPAPLAPGERAVPIPASAAVTGPVGVLRSGMYVDVVASSGEGPSGRTRVIVAGAEVLTTESGDASGFGGMVLLRASAAESLRITSALNFARDVRLLVRPVDEPRPDGLAP